MRFRAELWDWIKTITIAVIIVVILHFFVFNLSTVEGRSMEPTLIENDWLFVNKLAYKLGNPKLGDIVILEDPYPEETTSAAKKKFLVKRVVGLPGDRIEISGGKLYRNGDPMKETYTDSPIEDLNFGPVVVQNNCYFVMGDNRHAHASLDSRVFHAVPKRLIVGRADFILWPYKQISVL
ncbi:signal peptidase I [Paenibacillus sp. HB172176]|uniref:signal peptidase I n=1 Tax=Paenibacillus sp. HB172176 TaxID=2493690 RepID=UPI00143A5581|nr:signal peptidase I [Paenibacillus sp. HB172176]